MFGSKSNYFYKPKDVLKYNQRQMVKYLVSQNYTMIQIGIYEKAFEYFCDNPGKFDGATIVKDLHHIPGLDMNAMLHDYQYIVYRCASDLAMKRKCDWLYAKEMERMGKGQLSWVNWGLLKLSGIPFFLYSLSKNGAPTEEMQRKFLSDYDCLMKK